MKKLAPRHYRHREETQLIFENYWRCDDKVTVVFKNGAWDVLPDRRTFPSFEERGIVDEEEMWELALKIPQEECFCSDSEILRAEIEEALETEK